MVFNLKKLQLDWNKIFGFSFFLAVIIGFFYIIVVTFKWSTNAELMPLSRIIVQGKVAHTRVNDIRSSVLTIDNMGSFLTQDVNEIQDHIEKLPWVDKVSIRKQWPDIIKLNITEHEAAAIWNDKKLLTPMGEIFSGKIIDLKQKNLARLFGDDLQSDEVMKAYKRMQPLFLSANLSIKEVLFSLRHAWTIVLSNGIRLKLGRESLDERVNRFLYFYPHLKNKYEQIDYVDLRYDIGFAVGWK